MYGSDRLVDLWSTTPNGSSWICVMWLSEAGQIFAEGVKRAAPGPGVGVNRDMLVVRRICPARGRLPGILGFDTNRIENLTLLRSGLGLGV